MCATWITPMVMDDVSHAYITSIKTGLPRYVKDGCFKNLSLVQSDLTFAFDFIIR